MSESQHSKISKTARQAIPPSKRYPVSVYRLNFSSAFTFRDAAEVVPYLHELGISDVYASPYLKARPGSMHGYDVIDHGKLNPEIGTRAEYDRFVRQLKKHNMGQIMDFIPNHMGIFDNPFWLDVLENGPSSSSARFFDIDWEPVKAELRGKVLLPILEDLYGNVLQAGGLSLKFDDGAFVVQYYGNRLPIEPKTGVAVLEPVLNPLRESLGPEHQDYLELQSVITAYRNLPGRDELSPDKMAERQREKEIIKKRLGELCARNSVVREILQREITSINGKPGDNSSFARLHSLLEQQVYRLSYWRVASDEINYRRFFDVNELVAIKMEDPFVFEESHRLVRELLKKGALTGIRVDHVDGLFNPADYLWRLQRAYLQDSTGQSSDLFEAERKRDPKSPFVQPLYIVVEKILGENEELRDSWPVDGTTGYEFAVALNRLFVDDTSKRSLLYTYRHFTDNRLSFDEIVYQSKSLVMRTSMSAEVNLLAHQLDKLSERSWQNRDFTLDSLRDAIREVIASFPVYRTYIDAGKDTVDESDRAIINSAVSKARRRNPAVNSAIFNFIRDTLLLRYPVGLDEDGRNHQKLFEMRFQQFTGPVTAKGVEDTAFYIYNPLVSLNEVGGNPQVFGSSVSEFHHQNRERWQKLPHSFIGTSTHDTKRGEDVRARLNVLSEMPGEWRAALKRWSRLNRNRKTSLSGESVPDENEEYLIYQTLVGSYPLGMSRREAGVYSERVQQYMLKAIREAKVHTSWVNSDAAYEDGVVRFVRDILSPSRSGEFLGDLASFLEPIATCGVYNSLSQTVLKLFSPGVPDIYQGNELLALNLTDPDNRRPVDFDKRVRLLEELKKQPASQKSQARFIRKLVETRDDGIIKLYITWKSLNYRRGQAGLFEGSYLPLRVTGAKRDHLCAFTWKKGKQTLVIAVPRLIAGLTRLSAVEPMGGEAWGDTALVLPANFRAARYQNIFTGESVKTAGRGSRLVLPVADTLATFPVAVLESTG